MLINEGFAYKDIKKNGDTYIISSKRYNRYLYEIDSETHAQTLFVVFFVQSANFEVLLYISISIKYRCMWQKVSSFLNKLFDSTETPAIFICQEIKSVLYT